MDIDRRKSEIAPAAMMKLGFEGCRLHLALRVRSDDSIDRPLRARTMTTFARLDSALLLTGDAPGLPGIFRMHTGPTVRKPAVCASAPSHRLVAVATKKSSYRSTIQRDSPLVACLNRRSLKRDRK